jgi:porphobilinogen synthase
MAFPITRPRRLRRNDLLRAAVRETRLAPTDFVYPLFVCPGEGVRREVSAMPDTYQMSVDQIVAECREVAALSIPAVLLFGLPETKDLAASGAYDHNGIVQRAIRAIKQEVKNLLVIADCCLCEYTSHGHCGHIVDGDVDNDKTLDLLSKAALAQARAGVPH